MGTLIRVGVRTDEKRNSWPDASATRGAILRISFFRVSMLLLLVVILSTRRAQMREGPASSLLSALAFRCHPERAKRRGISLRLCLWAHQNPQQRKSPQVVASQPRYKPARSASLSLYLSREPSLLASRPASLRMVLFLRKAPVRATSSDSPHPRNRSREATPAVSRDQAAYWMDLRPPRKSPGEILCVNAR